MKIELKFRHTPPSDELQAYVTDRTAKLQKFELRPIRLECTFTAQKTAKRVDLHVRGLDVEIHAHSEAEDYFTGFDHALEKVARQLARKKARLQEHIPLLPKPAKVS